MTTSLPRTHAPSPVEPNDTWRADAACRELDVERFFPLPGDTAGTDQAVTVCRSCPVRDQCLDYALANQELFGIWGGLTEPERESLLRAGIALESALFLTDTATMPPG